MLCLGNGPTRLVLQLNQLNISFAKRLDSGHLYGFPYIAPGAPVNPYCQHRALLCFPPIYLWFSSILDIRCCYAGRTAFYSVFRYRSPGRTAPSRTFTPPHFLKKAAEGRYFPRCLRPFLLLLGNATLTLRGLFVPWCIRLLLFLLCTTPFTTLSQQTFLNIGLLFFVLGWMALFKSPHLRKTIESFPLFFIFLSFLTFFPHSGFYPVL